MILICTILAIVWGPVKAVELTRIDQTNNEKDRRRRAIFHDLMKYRRLDIQPERVNALNLVQLEFYGAAEVNAAYKAYIDQLWIDLPTDPEPRRRQIEKRNELYVELLCKIAKELGLTFDKLDLQRLSYSPQGWMDEMDEIQQFRRLMIELLNGQRSLPINDLKVNSQLFPPTPR
jgi:hypothetical protein